MGFKLHPRNYSLRCKLNYLQSVVDVGFDIVDIGSFVSSKAIPQLSDTKEIIELIDLSNSDSKLLTIVANNKGAENASTLEKISFSSAVTRKFVTSKKNKDGLTEMVRTVTDFDDFQVGDNVEHSIFGTGKIMALSGTGENQRVGVVFNDGTRKKLIVKFANLKKI